MAYAPRSLPALIAAMRIAAFALLVSACSPDGVQAQPGQNATLILERAIPLMGVKGRIDHLAVDVAHGRLFVAELGNGSVEAIDLKQGRSLGRITGLREPQGVAYLPSSDQLFVASGGDGTLRSYRGADLKPDASLNVGSDADNLRLDAGGRIVVGYGDGALATIDPATMRLVRQARLPGHPEGFRLDGERAFVNVPDAGQIIVSDLASGQVTASWKAAHRWNFPMILDVAADRVAVVYRLPSRLVILAGKSGKVVSDTPTCGDADDVFLDSHRARIYVVCGSGAVDVVETASGGFRSMGRVATRSGARTGLFVPELDRLFVAARAGARGQEAAILVYRPTP